MGLEWTPDPKVANSFYSDNKELNVTQLVSGGVRFRNCMCLTLEPLVPTMVLSALLLLPELGNLELGNLETESGQKLETQKMKIAWAATMGRNANSSSE